MRTQGGDTARRVFVESAGDEEGVAAQVVEQPPVGRLPARGQAAVLHSLPAT